MPRQSRENRVSTDIQQYESPEEQYEEGSQNEDEEEDELSPSDREKIGDRPSTISLKQRRSIKEQTHDLRILLNKIFSIRGGWVVKNIARDFSDGFLFQELFNILYDERVDCCLEGVMDNPNPNLPYETKVCNWNKINAGICFNYFQQQFFFVQGTMQTLAKGKNGVLTAQAIRELLIAMQGTHHNTFDDDVDVREIADVLKININNAKGE